MNCREFHSVLMREPACTDVDFLQHADECDTCHREYQETMAFEALLRESVEVEVPADLSDRLLQKVRQSEQPASAAGMRRISLAASFLILFFLIGWMGFEWGGQTAYAEDLPEVVAQHMTKERDLLSNREALSETTVAPLLSRIGAVMHASLGVVVFAEPCWIRHQRGAHLVISDASGPVTLLFMPGEHLVKPQTLVWEHQSGLIVPTDFGSLAIVAVTPKQVENMRQRIHQVLMFST